MKILDLMVAGPRVLRAEREADDGETSSPVAWSATPIYEWRARADAERKARRPKLLTERMGWPSRAVSAASEAD